MNFHILNGDALSLQFPQEITGEKILFRECLVDGPVSSDSEDTFWENRRRFIETEFEETNYEIYSKAEILQISEIPGNSNIYFWFEADLFCQVNFWKACTLLPPSTQSAFLVMPGSNSPYSFAHLSKEDLISQWENAVELHLDNLELFQSLWKSFQNSEPESALQSVSNFEGKFPFLIPAIQAWKEMIPNENFEGLPKEELKKIHQELQTENFGTVFREFHRRLPIYGFGDTQVSKLWQIIKKGS